MDTATSRATEYARYAFEETSDGFTITKPDRTACVVRLVDNELTVDYEGRYSFVPPTRYGLFETYSLIRNVASAVMHEWEPRKGCVVPDKIRKWAMQRTQMALGKGIQKQVLRLRERCDPRSVAMQRAVFAATFSHARFAARPEFYRRKYVTHDVTAYRAAAVALSQLQDLAFAHAVPPTPEAMEDWMGLLAPHRQPYRALHKTLMNWPGGLPASSAVQLASARMERAMTTRLELGLWLCAVSYTILGVRGQQYNNVTDVVNRSTPEHIAQAIRILSDSVPQENAYPVRKYKSMAALADTLCDYNQPYNGNVFGYTRRALAWHRELQETMRAMKGAKREARPTALPPIPLPDIEGVTFLADTEQVRAEGEAMHHCIASYAAGAAAGHHYLFHIEHQGDRASASISPQGTVSQIYGPHNSENKATQWGKKVLSQWSQPMRVADGSAIADSR